MTWLRLADILPLISHLLPTPCLSLSPLSAAGIWNLRVQPPRFPLPVPGGGGGEGGLSWQSPAPSRGVGCLAARAPRSRVEMMVCCDGGSGQPAHSNAVISGRQACCLHLAGPQGLAWCPGGLACFGTPGYKAHHGPPPGWDTRSCSWAGSWG